MGITSLPKGLSSYGIPILPGIPDVHTGNFWFVDNSTAISPSITGVDSYGTGYGLTPQRPFASLAYALTQCKANNDDVIIMGNGHVEAITAATLAASVAGVTILGTGSSGSQRSTLSLNATAANIALSGANSVIANCRILTGIDAVAVGVTITGADARLLNCEYYDQPGMASTIQILTSAAANRLLIDGYRYYASTTGTQKTDGIKIVGGDHVVVRNAQIEGNFSAGAFDNATTAGTNMVVENCYFNNTSTSPTPAVVLQAATTGWMKNNKLAIYSGSTYSSSFGAMEWDALCEGFTTLTGVTNSLGTNSNMGIKSVAKAQVVANLTGSNVAIFTIAGPAGAMVKVNAFGLIVTTAMAASSNTVSPFFTPTGGSATAIGAGTTDLNAAAVNQLVVLDGVKATAMTKTTDVGISIASALHMPIYLSSGVINITYGGTPASGACTYFLDYEPMGPGITVS